MKKIYMCLMVIIFMMLQACSTVSIQDAYELEKKYDGLVRKQGETSAVPQQDKDKEKDMDTKSHIEKTDEVTVIEMGEEVEFSGFAFKVEEVLVTDSIYTAQEEMELVDDAFVAGMFEQQGPESKRAAYNTNALDENGDSRIDSLVFIHMVMENRTNNSRELSFGGAYGILQADGSFIYSPSAHFLYTDKYRDPVGDDSAYYTMEPGECVDRVFVVDDRLKGIQDNMYISLNRIMKIFGGREGKPKSDVVLDLGLQDVEAVKK